MKGVAIRRLSAAIAIAVMTSATFVTGASAQPVETGSLAFTSDPGDWVGQGGSYSYSTASGDELNVSNSYHNIVLSISVLGANGDRWSLMIAGSDGHAIAPGEYSFTNWVPCHPQFNGPGLVLSGDRSCWAQSGSFTIHNITFGPIPYVQTLDATFVQWCESPDAALRGEVHIANPAPPPPLELDATIAPEGSASRLNGSATVHGTVSCTAPVTVGTTVRVTQVVKRVITRGSGHLNVACTPERPTAWTANVDPSGTTPFQKGDAEVVVTASATDPVYFTQVTIQRTGPVKLDSHASGVAVAVRLGTPWPSI
jgi:hypothetical protein